MQRAPQIRKLWRHNSVTLEKIFMLLLEVSIFFKYKFLGNMNMLFEIDFETFEWLTVKKKNDI